MSSKIPAPTIGATLAARAALQPADTAYIDGDRPFSWADIDAAADRVAASLLRLGFRKGDRIGVIALNRIEWLQAFFGAMRAGIAVVGLSVRYRDTGGRESTVEVRLKTDAEYQLTTGETEDEV